VPSSTDTSADSPRERRRVAARRAAGVLAQRLRRSCIAHCHRSLSDSGTLGRLSTAQHSADSRAFEGLPHRVAGRSLTLDDIEKKVLPEFHDPRVYLALGRGAVGSGRLRSEVFEPARLEAQLTQVASECASRPVCLQIERANNRVLATPIFSWREQEFSAGYAGSAGAVFASRSPIERAILSFVELRLLPAERQFLAQNTFQVTYQPFDWNLNDLTGRGGR